MLSWPTRERGLAENIIPRQSPEVGERNERAVVGEGVEPLGSRGRTAKGGQQQGWWG